MDSITVGPALSSSVSASKWKRTVWSRWKRVSDTQILIRSPNYTLCLLRCSLIHCFVSNRGRGEERKDESRGDKADEQSVWQSKWYRAWAKSQYSKASSESTLTTWVERISLIISNTVGLNPGLWAPCCLWQREEDCLFCSTNVSEKVFWPVRLWLLMVSLVETACKWTKHPQGGCDESPRKKRKNRIFYILTHSEHYSRNIH